MSAGLPKTRTARQMRISEIIERNAVTSQAQLRTLLADAGIDVTQATLSRDLDELRAYKEYNSDSIRVYRVPDPVELSFSDAGAPAQLERWISELMTNATSALNQVIVRTVPGAAQLLASAIDRAVIDGILGCIAGDDTILIVTDGETRANVILASLLDAANKK